MKPFKDRKIQKNTIKTPVNLPSTPTEKNGNNSKN